MRRALLLSAAALLLIAAKDGKKEERAPLLLASADLDPALVLPPPAPDGSPSTQAELGFLHMIDRTRSAADAEQAAAAGKIKSGAIFAQALGAEFDLAKLPATRALLDTVRAEEKEAVHRAKDHFQRKRPYVTDTGLHPCSVNEDPLSSYPSGHTTMAYSMAAILARLIPGKAPAIMAAAADYARTRLTCEQHYPSDVAAGEAYGMLVAERLMTVPAFRSQFEKARLELHAAGERMAKP
jgi:acid phosphatase (class A)